MTKKERTYIENRIAEYDRLHEELRQKYDRTTDIEEKNQYLSDSIAYFNKSITLEQLLIELDNL